MLALHQRKLDRLNQLYEVQTRKLVFLQRQHKAATKRLNKRIVEIYTTEPTSTLSVVLESSSFSELLDQLEFLNEIGRQDEKVTNEVKRAKEQMQEVRNATRKTRKQVAAVTREVAARTIRAARRPRPARLGPARARDGPPRQASDARERAGGQGACARAHALAAGAECDARREDSLGPELRGRPGADRTAVRGRLHLARSRRPHERLRLALGPHARGDRSRRPGRHSRGRRRYRDGDRRRLAGRLRKPRRVDHGNGIATAYGHNTSVTVGVGQSVAQGQLISYSGNTGHSTGPHVHFEVRINGTPVDPLGYL